MELARKRRFAPEWVDAFLDVMEADLTRWTYDSVEAALGCVYGWAEVVGLFMARIMDLPEAALPYARLFGRAMQCINFTRDVDEDMALGRQSPSGHAAAGGEPGARPGAPGRIRRLLSSPPGAVHGWQREWETGFASLPRRLRVPTKTASDTDAWTGERIRRDPMVLFRRKVKPGRARIVLPALADAVAP